MRARRRGAAAGRFDLRRRSTEPELMDDFEIGGAEIDVALRELAVVNRLLGGISTSLALLAPLLRGRRRSVRILDVGTGGADIPVAVARWCRRAGVPLELVALDLGADACRCARARSRAYPEITIVRATVAALPFAPASFDIVHSAMFLHHFPGDEIVAILRRLRRLARGQLVINDLHRHALAYHAIRALTRCFSRSRLVRNDAPLSVRRAFRRAELEEIGRRCAFAAFEVRWRWAFRYGCVATV